MYSLPCAHCGQKEIFHAIAPDLDLYRSGGELENIRGWEISDFGEELDGIDDLRQKKPGYRKNLRTAMNLDTQKGYRMPILQGGQLITPTRYIFFQKK